MTDFTLNPLITNYVYASLSQLRRLDLMRGPGSLPEQMRDDSIPPSNDWIRWKPIPSTVSDSDLDGLEGETGLAFPPLYRHFLQYQHFLSLTEVGVRFAPHLSHNWRETLSSFYLRSWRRDRILDVGLLPFGDEALMDAGPVCFDTVHRTDGGDCPVVFWDHEWIGTDKEVRPMFSSSTKMFECLTLVAATDFNFVCHDDDEGTSVLSQKQDLLAKFLAIDPSGAGESGRDYWTSWGVTTKA